MSGTATSSEQSISSRPSRETSKATGKQVDHLQLNPPYNTSAESTVSGIFIYINIFNLFKILLECSQSLFIVRRISRDSYHIKQPLKQANPLQIENEDEFFQAEKSF